MAMAARVPIVPIIFRNALDALPKHAVVLRPATVEVVVHAPIPTEDWRVGDLPGQIEAIERLYREVLDA
jgi:putative phosphoserine phosphatase/1-acylglycerol-3-phosphate O-acyltransferase